MREVDFQTVMWCAVAEQVAKLDELGLSWTQNAMINARFSEVVVDLITAGGFFTDIHDFDFYNFVTDMTGDSYYATGGDSQLSTEQRQAIMLGTERATPGSGRCISRTTILRRLFLRCPAPGSMWCGVGMSYYASKYSWWHASCLSSPSEATGNGWEVRALSQSLLPRVVALIATFNEADVIGCVIEHLIESGVELLRRR